ncbi:extracellular solute-binding protein [Histidinibacterium lentulum]|uniref:Extracellular solute-binding protein n=1 Tax=Histidinibacterium lentulum TaxID=2480588 RepID=A0A3N2R5G8_9RHOB|nr:extracellular solute-binding protein [Histidinibacterium lentulum]ROU02601.1 extracellular solute-binding protein [Histidinibacterium lentulum]
MTYLGLTWDHPRGYDALAEAARREPLVHWERQPLEGFESAPITELAAAYDLLVLDHPHIGEAVAEDCLVPLEDLFPPERIAQWQEQTVGPAFVSYRWDGRHWALPLDVATQVMARRPDRLAAPPATWEEVEEIARRLPVALSLAGPHALLTLLSMAAGQGAPVGGDAMLPDAPALEALSRMARLAALAPEGSDRLNPISLLETMARTEDIAFVPLVFGYVTYSGPIAFSDTIRSATGRGGTLGGTGIAVTRRTRPDAALLAHLAWLMSTETQSGLIPGHNGQPSARAAWDSEAVNAAAANFYADTRATAEKALLRPRFDGMPAFTNAASARLRTALTTGEDIETTLAALRRLWRDARARARGDLDDRTDP